VKIGGIERIDWDKDRPKTDEFSGLLTTSGFEPDFGCRSFQLDGSDTLLQLESFTSIPF
jgi:hypothetical protein